jgi:hypothetical protein
MKKFVLLPLLLLMFIGCEITETEVVPLPPGNLVATVVSSNQVDLVWKDNSTNETGFKIERKTDGGSFTEIGTTSKDLTTYSDQTVSLLLTPTEFTVPIRLENHFPIPMRPVSGQQRYPAYQLQPSQNSRQVEPSLEEPLPQTEELPLLQEE